LRLNLATLFDRQLLVHKTALARAKASPEEIDTLEELLEEIGAHGVFGAAYLAVADRLEGGAGEVVEGINASLPDKSSDLLSFFHDRLKVYLKDRGIRHDVIDACLAMPGGDDLTLLVKRAEALNAVLQTDDGANLLQAFKRANNILTQAEEKDGVEYSYGPDAKFAEGDEETAVFAALDTAETEIAAAMATEDFAAAMGAMAGMRGPIDRFFETVQINTDNAILRRNRLNLLSRIRTVCGSVADLTRIEG
jgi:glycyl-tRNA synthetase beta chain